MPERSVDEKDVADRLRAAPHILVLTGAGISAESGIPTFRGPGGLWKNYRPEQLATPEAFARDPKLVWEWYAWRRSLVAAAEPNAGHLALAKLEQRSSALLLVTQNVDGLHRRAGSHRVVELHGDLWTTRCVQCGSESREADLGELPPRCLKCGGLLRPGVVWFGEPLPSEAVTTAFAAASKADVVLVVGTSGVVYPAAQLPIVAQERGAYVVEVNVERTPLTSRADAVFIGPATEILPRLVS